MKSSCVVLALLLLALNMASRLSLAGAATAAAHDHESASASASVPAILGRELRGFIARAGNIFRPAGAWRATNATAAAEAKNLRAVAASRRRRPATRKSSGGSGAGCVSAATCRKRRVICAKRCYGASRAATASSLINHVPSRCVVRCKKCVPTC